MDLFRHPLQVPSGANRISYADSGCPVEPRRWPIERALWAGESSSSFCGEGDFESNLLGCVAVVEWHLDVGRGWTFSCAVLRREAISRGVGAGRSAADSW